MTLHRLSPTQIAQIVSHMTEGKTLPPEVPSIPGQDRWRCPFFVEEITKALLGTGQLIVIDGHYVLAGSFATFAIPATLQDSLMARLDRLMTGKVIAQLGAAIGRQFAYDLLQAVSYQMQPLCSVSWDGSSKRRLCTNEVCHPKRPTCSNMPSFRMQRMRHSSRVRGNAITNALCRYLRNCFQRRLRHSLNSQRITVRKRVSLPRLLAIGSGAGHQASDRSAIWKLSATSPPALSC